MNCVCRTKSLSIFVQSLTELRVADPAISRSVRLNRAGSQFAFRQTPARYPARLFSSATDTTNNESSTLIPSASSNDLTAAKINGAILEYSPESIDKLIASLDRTSITGQEDIPDKPANLDYDAQPESQPRPKPPITSSQLKRRKIIKEDKPRPPAKGARVHQEDWQIQKHALKEKFPEGWRPRKRLSPDALDGIRALHAQFPEQYPTDVLARHFEVSVEAIRRILKSKWTPNPDEETRRQERWFNRGKNIWSQMAELGKKPPRKWRREGVVRKPHWNEKKGPRTEYPYVPRRQPPQAEFKGPVESAQRKLSGSLI
ncbi:hypothetical protein F5Y03DRAFT_379914 [Xylaria venustula]|nr:hypothetical protein F5Y03DRAFT_379914 [Xylaria venustula]